MPPIKSNKGKKKFTPKIKKEIKKEYFKDISGGEKASISNPMRIWQSDC